MKNFDMRLFPLRFGQFWGIRLGVYLHARSHFLHAFHDDAIARLQSFIYDPLGADHFAHFHRLNRHFIAAVQQPLPDSCLGVRKPLAAERAAHLFGFEWTLALFHSRRDAGYSLRSEIDRR